MMKHVQLGQSDVTVSTVAMGCWGIAGGSNWGRQDQADSIAAIHASLDHGVNTFDTAPAYGKGYSEQLLGQALAGRRDSAVIMTKVSTADASTDRLIPAVERSLEHLATDRIDLLQLHWPNRNVPMADVFGEMTKLVDAGKVRAVAACNLGPADLEDVLSQTPIVSNQVAYSLVFRAIEFEIAPLCHERGVSIMPYSPLAEGMLAGKFTTADEVPVGRARTRHFADSREQTRHGEPGCETQTFEAISQIRTLADSLGLSIAHLSLAWCLYQPGVATVLAGARNAEHAIANAAAKDVPLDSNTIDQLNRITDPLKQQLGPNADPWCGGDDSRMR
jgi:myo-inositol catabolism protein IolS